MTRLQDILARLPKLVIPLPPLTTFTFFPKLPPELRNRVWKYAAMVPRDIKLERRNYNAGFNDQPGAPAILLASREARDEGKRYYTYCYELKMILRQSPYFSGNYNRLDPRLRSATRICQRNTVWINFSVDRFIHNNQVLHYRRWSLNSVEPINLEGQFCFDDNVIDRIQHLALNFASARYRWVDIYDAHLALRNLKNLLGKVKLNELTLIESRVVGKAEMARSENWLKFDEELRQKEERVKNDVFAVQKNDGWKLLFNIELKFGDETPNSNQLTEMKGYVRSTRIETR